MNRPRSLLIVASLALAGCSLFRAEPAEAGTVVVSWTNPTLNTDDSPIPTTQGDPEALQSWRIEFGTCAAGGAFGATLGEFIRTRPTAGAPLATATQNVPAGPKCFRVFVRNFMGNESTASNVSARDIPAGTPRPATNVTAVLQGS
jgi:hypothetical protein